MLRIIFVLAILTLVVSGCDKKKGIENEIVGKWQITEQLVDPGDGSGTYQPVQGNKTIVFNANGTFYSSGSICSPGDGSGNGSQGNYDSNTQMLTGVNCGVNTIDIYYELSNNELIIIYPCIEACREKFIKIN